MTRSFRSLACAAALLLLATCARTPPRNAYQISTIDALLDGNYHGDLTFADLKGHGDFGLGTFDALDGEMIALDGHFFQIRSDGHASEVSPETRTPFSVVTFFRPDSPSKRIVGPVDYHTLQRQLDALRDGDGHAFAFEIEGHFTALRVRSVPRQRPPYRPLAQVVKEQAIFDLSNVQGTLVGFWFPESMRHVNVPGYHFHFIAADHSAGGHVLDGTLSTGVARVQLLQTVQIELPRTPPTTRPIERDRSGELRDVEQQ